MQRLDTSTLGWREWLSLPELGIVAIKAKIDTGARSCSLAVTAAEPVRRDGVLYIAFEVRPRRRSVRSVACSAPVVDRRAVTDSSGRTTERWFIRSRIVIGGAAFDADINLTDRGDMLFPMLIGRSALEGRYRVDPALSYTFDKPRRHPARP